MQRWWCKLRLAYINGKYYRPCKTVVYDKQGHTKQCYWDNDTEQLCFMLSNGKGCWVRPIENDRWYYDWDTDTIRLK